MSFNLNEHNTKMQNALTECVATMNLRSAPDKANFWKDVLVALESVKLDPDQRARVLVKALKEAAPQLRAVTKGQGDPVATWADEYEALADGRPTAHSFLQPRTK